MRPSIAWLDTLRTRSALACLLGVSILGPNVVGGVRTDEILVYLGAGVGLLLWLLRRTSVAVGRWGLWVVAAWGLLAASAFAGWVVAGPHLTSHMISDADDVLLPLAVCTMVWTCFAATDMRRTLWLVTLTVTIGLAINTSVALLQALGAIPVGGSIWLPPDAVTIARSAANQRFPGILNQPALAGVMYALDIVLLMTARPVTRWAVAASLWLTVGAVLAASKAFFLAVVLAAVVVLVARFKPRAWQVVVGLVAALLAATAALLVLPHLPALPGIAHLQRLVGHGFSLGNLSGNRFGGSNQNAGITHRAMDESPLFGLGLGGLDGSTDSGVTHALALAGLVGLLAFVACVALLGIGLIRTSASGTRRRLVAYGCLTVVIAGNVGFPVFVSNRLGTMVWVVLALLLVPTPDQDADDVLPSTPAAGHRRPVRPALWRRRTAPVSAPSAAED